MMKTMNVQGQNLSGRQITVSALITVFTLISAALFFYFWQRLLLAPYVWLLGDFSSYLTIAIAFVMSLILFLAFDSLLNLLVTSQSLRLAAYAIIAFLPLGLSYYFNQTITIIHVLTSMLLFFALWYFSYTAQKSIREHISFRAGHIFGPRIGSFLTLLAIALTLQYYLAAQVNLSQFKFEIPDYLFDSAFDLTEQILQNQFLPGGGVQGEFDQILLQQLPVEAQELIPLIKEGRLPPEIKDEIKRSLPPGMSFEEFEEMVKNIPITNEGQVEIHPGSETFRQDYLAPVKNQIQDKLNQIIEPYKSYAPLVLAILLFITFKSLGFILDWLAVIALSIMIGFLKLLGVIEVKKEKVEAERLEMV